MRETQQRIDYAIQYLVDQSREIAKAHDLLGVPLETLMTGTIIKALTLNAHVEYQLRLFSTNSTQNESANDEEYKNKT